MPTYDFDGRVALVTGAGRGLGRSHARHLARHGADVVATDRCVDLETSPYGLASRADLEATADLVREEGGEALALEVDVRDEAAVEAAVAEAVDALGGVDVLVANAGLWNVADLLDLEEARWDDLVDTNLKGTWLPAKHVGRHLVERGEGGRIVTTGSVAGALGVPGSGHYAAAKHGVVGLTRSLAVELAPHGVTVNCVAPTGADTPMVEGMVAAEGEAALASVSDAVGPMNLVDDQLVPPADVSEAVLWLASDAARYVTGTVLPVDGGMLARWG